MKTIPYGRQSIAEDDIQAVIKTLNSRWITQGPMIKKFEDALCEYTGARYAVCVSSATAALHIACLASGIRAQDEVITSPISFVASANSILYSRLKPVFADIREDTVNIDPVQIEKRITKKTRALLPVHFAGHPCDLEEIGRIARRYKLIVIEDAAHALGARYKDSKIGSCRYSDMTILSFHPVKHITTGEGGVVLTNRKDLYEKLLMLRNHGITKDKRKMSRWDGSWYYEQLFLGFNYRITDFQCALGFNQLKKLDGFLERRREIAHIYNQKLSAVSAIDLPVEKPYAYSSWHIYYIRLKDSSKRKAVFDKLHNCGIGVQIHYIPVHLQPYYRRNFGFRKGSYPKAEDYYKRTITIPLYPEMKPAQIRYVVKTIKRYLDEDSIS